MKNAKGCFGSDVVARNIRSHMTQLDTRQWWWRVTSWVKHDGLLHKLKMHRGIDGMFAFSSGLCSWINKDSRICSRRPLLSLPMTSGLWKSTRWSGLACKCLHTAELSDVRCSSIRFISIRDFCILPHTQVANHEDKAKSFQHNVKNNCTSQSAYQEFQDINSIVLPATLHNRHLNAYWFLLK